LLVEERDIATWVEGYIKAWNSNNPEDIGRLFTDEALYFTAPFREPWRGRDEIVSGWIEKKDEPDTTEFSYDVEAIDGSLGIVRGRTIYKDPLEQYSNLWQIRLDESGRCYEFVEWWMEEK
jgi:SnoaL-like domain